MAIFTADTRVSILHKMFGAVDYTPSASWDIAVVTIPPEDDLGTGLVEPWQASYERLTIANDATQFEVSSDGTEIVNAEEWEFPQADDSAWGTVVGLALFNAGDEYVGYVPFSSPKYIALNNILKISAGSFVISMEPSPLSIYIEETAMPIIRTSPDGSRFVVGVDNSGDIVTTATSAFGPPTAPSTLVNTDGVLSWTLSTGTGETPIISQTMWFCDADSRLVTFTVLASDEVSFEVPEGVAGDFYVTAENIIGSSDPSNVVTISP